jgi:DNA-binding transcriptional regulator YiaG
MAAYKPRAFYPPQPEQFAHHRLIANLKPKDVAAMLHVSEKTVKNWESGKTQIPYSAFKLLKVLTN